MDTEKDKVPVEEQQEVTIERTPETTFEEQPETTVEEQPKTTFKEQPETTGEEQPKSTVEEQPETTIKEQPEATAVNQQEVSIEKQLETFIKEEPENQTQNTEKVNDLGEKPTNEEVKDLKLEDEMIKDNQTKTEEQRAEEEKDSKEETLVKTAIANDEGEQKNIPTEITTKEKQRVSKISASVYSEFSGDASMIDSKSLRREIRARKRKIRLELLQKKEPEEDSRFSDSSSESSSIHEDEERRISNLLALKESLLPNTLSLSLAELSEQLLDSAKSRSVQQIDRLYSLSHRVDFIENFEDLPSLSSFSIETTDDEEIIVIPRIKEGKEVVLDQGVFVNPLTGEIESSSTITTETVNVLIHEEGEVEGEDQSGVDDIDIDIISIPEEPIDIFEEEDASKTFEAFAALKKVFSTEEISFETEEMILARQQRAMTYEFLYQLIDAVVEKGEIIDQNALLARSISKTKLFQRLVTQLTLLIQEKLLNNELVRRTTDCYKRLKNFRNITPLPLHIHETESKNYSNNLMRLDFLLKKENESLIHSYVQTDIESSRNDELENELQESENNFKNLIVKTFGSQRLAIMRSRLESDLKVMAKKRVEIGKARLALIKRQHIVATLQEKLAALEEITKTLTLSTFISKQTEVLKIDKKIEERYFEFKKLQFTFTSEMHKLAHVKEKTQFIEENMKYQQRIFDKLLAQNLEKRELLYKLKLEHSKIIRNIREKSFQSGLLVRPALMFDYDNTTDELSLQNEKVLQIQKKMNILQLQIEEAEKKLHNQVK